MKTTLLPALVLSLMLSAAASAQTGAREYFNAGRDKLVEGDMEGAVSEFNWAIRMDPTTAAYQYFRGYARAANGDLEGALADCNRAIELDPKLAAAYVVRGTVKALTRKWTDALADYRRSCEMPNDEQDYPRLFIWLIRARLGETEAAGKDLSAWLDKRAKAAPGDWVSSVGGFLLGKVTEKNFFTAAASPDAKKGRRQQCEAWFFAGMKKLLGGDKAAAADDFHKCLATEQNLASEYHLAEAELKTLAQ